MALVSKNFSDIITFTRASSATFTGSNGLIQTAATNAPRFDYDPVTLAAKGLLIEEQRTNLFLYSQEFNNIYWTLDSSTISANAIAAPDGTTTADRLVGNNGATGSAVYRSVVVLSGTTYTFSGFVKSDGVVNWVQLVATGATVASPARVWFNISTGAVGTNNGGFTNPSIRAFGNGWYRVTATYTTTSTSSALYFANSDADNVNTFAGNGVNGAYFWGAQLEAGSFATSYIPTVASQVTRSADLASVNTLSPWFNATEGTLYVEASAFVNVTTVFAYSAAAFNDGTQANRIESFLYDGRWGSRSVVSSVTQADLLQIGSYSANIPAKSAFAFRQNDFSVSVNGLTPLTDTAGNLPTVSQLGVGSRVGASQLNGHIRRITYYPRRLSNAELQALTA